VIEQAFDMGINGDEHHEIKVADDLAVIFERVTLRSRKAWEGEKDIESALADGWVASSTLSEMRALLKRLPPAITPLSHGIARHTFLQEFHARRLTWRRR